MTLSGPSSQLQELRQYLAEQKRERDFLDGLLPAIWNSLNVRCFGGSLKRVPMFRFVDFEGDIMGRFVELDDGCIIEVHRMFLDGSAVTEAERIIAVGAVILHEMAHQKLIECGSRERDPHGREFSKVANRLSGIMGIGGRISTEGEYQCRYWPFDVDEELSGIVSRLRSSDERVGVPSDEV